MISEQENTRISKFLSLILRHKPESISISLDENGWADADLLIKGLNSQGVKIDMEILKFVVQSNSKQRFSFNDSFEKIRANQGHSLDVDMNFKPSEPPEILYHGTAEKSVPSILATGLQKQARQHVHLSSNFETAIAVGRRYGRPVVFEVLAKEMFKNQHHFFLSENGVWLTNSVPTNFLRMRD